MGKPKELIYRVGIRMSDYRATGQLMDIITFKVIEEYVHTEKGV